MNGWTWFRSQMLADFTINIHEGRKPMGVRVVVHEDIPALRKAAQMHYNNWPGHKQEVDGLDDILGVCHRFHMADDPVLAVVRLAPPNVGAGMVAHELTHAAVWLWQIQTKFDKKVQLTCENDEWFAWVLGELVRHTTVKLLENDIY